MSGPDDSDTPSDREVLDAVVWDILDGFHTGTLARVESVDYEKQTINAQPVVRRRFIGGDGRPTHERLPVAVGVPVAFPIAGGGASGLKFPLPVGSTVLLVHLSHSIDRFLLVGREVNADSSSRNTMNEVVAFPVGYSIFGAARPRTPWVSDAVVLYAAGGMQVRLVDDSASAIVAINSESIAIVEKLNEVIDVLNTLIGKYNSHSHTGHGVMPAPVDRITEDVSGPADEPAGSPLVRVPGGAVIV